MICICSLLRAHHVNSVFFFVVYSSDICAVINKRLISNKIFSLETVPIRHVLMADDKL